MKKLYSLLAIGACATATVFAAEPIQINVSDASHLSISNKAVAPQERMSADDVLEALGMDVNNAVQLSPEAVNRFKKGELQSKVRMNAGEEGEWVEAGIGTMTDGLLWTLLYTDGDMYSNKWVVGVDKYTTADYYNIFQPYYYGIQSINKWAGAEIISYDQGGGQYIQADDNWLIDATNLTSVVPESFYTGMKVNYENIGRVYVLSAEMVNELGASVPVVHGTLNSGKLTFPVGSLYYWLPEYRGHETGVNPFKYDQVIELPEGAASTISINMPYCYEGNQDVIEFAVNGNNIANTYIAAYALDFSASDLTADDYASVIKNGTPAGDLKSFKIGLEVKPTVIRPTMYSVVAVGVDAKGNIVATNVDNGYVLYPNQGDWRTLEGKATMVDNIIAGYYTQWSNEQLVCDIQEYTKTPGLYRLVNPYDYANWKYRDENIHESGHNHYIYLNCTKDDNSVYLEESPLGVDAGAGSFRVNSLAYNYLAAGQTPKTEWYGSKSGNTVTFPSKTIVVSEKNYKDNGWFYTNASGALKITIPAQSNDGVDDIAVDNAGEAEYFNLQGVRVAAPTAGQMMIVRRGNTVTKELVK